MKTEKTAVRHIIKELKQNIKLPAEVNSTLETIVFSKVELLPEFKFSKNILMYHSLDDEFPTKNTIKRWAEYKQIFLPRVKGLDLELLAYNSQCLKTGAFGIEEPTGNNTIPPQLIDLIIVPAMAFDPYGNRLGRGKGFYDRLLAMTPATRIGVGYDFQILDILPADRHDIKMHYVFTPNCSIHVK